MIATDRFVFLHLHKSGGTSVNRWLRAYFPDARRIGYHLPRREIPAELAALPMVGLVRNPWSYYVSWYSFQSGMLRPNVLFQVLSNDGRLGFDGTVRNMAALGSDDALLEALIARLPAGYGDRGLNLPAGEAAKIRGRDIGFYTFLHDHMYGTDGAVRVTTMEGMRDALPGLLRGLGAEVTDEARAALAGSPAANASAHLPYADYYDAALRDLVAERDSAVIERYGYRFGA